MTGRLVLIATPIGNLGDISPRAAAALAGASAIGCEDTRRTGRLLVHLGIAAPKLVVVNEHTEARAVPGLLQRIADGETVALVSDAGTPGVSDPGERLVAAAVGAGARVEVLPGPVAAVVALVGSGLPTGRWVMEGFLPRSGGARTARLRELATEPRTLVLYEAPHRLVRTLDDLGVHLGGTRPVVVARELTKLHEEWTRGTLQEVAAHWRDREPRGELVLVVAGAPEEVAGEADVDSLIRQLLAGGGTARQAADEVSRRLGVRRQATYRRALELADELENRR